jgi:hypothetical protein
MDASDRIKQRRDKTVFINKVNTLIVNNPGGDCANLASGCCNTTARCNKSFPSYEEKQEFTDGRLDYVCPDRN